MPGRSYSSTAYKYGFNGKEKDDEVSGTGNQYDYGFRIYNPRIAKFLSVDPLTKSYPMLTPYQFASNTPIMAIDLDGLEAVIVNKNNNTITIIANIIFVTKGSKNVQGTTELKKETEKLIVNQLSSNQRLIGGTMTLNFKLNYIDENDDESCSPISFEQAKKLAQESKVKYTDDNGVETEISGVRTSVVVYAGELDSDNPGLFTPLEINTEGPFNEIKLNKDMVNSFNRKRTEKALVHELGHYLGRRGLGGTEIDPQEYDHAGGVGGSDPGVTSRDDNNIKIVPNDLPQMYRGASRFGIKKVIEKDEKNKEK
jgi:RHS repeat-associated protein